MLKPQLLRVTQKDCYQHEQWVLIADGSIQFGNRKLLLVLAVPARRCNQGKSMSFKDVMPLILKVSASWKSEDIIQEINRQIDLSQITYCISDTGDDLTKSFKLLKCRHVSDINYKFCGLILKSGDF